MQIMYSRVLTTEKKRRFQSSRENRQSFFLVRCRSYRLNGSGSVGLQEIRKDSFPQCCGFAGGGYWIRILPDNLACNWHSVMAIFKR